MSEKAFLVDITKCQGCRGCQVACKQWNGLPGEKTTFFGGPEYTNPANLSALTWNHVVFYPLDRTTPERPVWNIKHTKCYHCAEANCMAVCPQMAIKKVDGWTVIDQDKCIGCGACVSACVYKVPGLSEINHKNDMGLHIIHRGKSHKCNACTLNKRDIPACVATCPSGALEFGHRQAVMKKALKRVKELKKEFPNANVYGLEEFGGLGVITVLRDKPEKYGLPVGKDAQKIDLSHYESINSIYHTLSVFTMGIPYLQKKAYNIAKALAGADKDRA